MPVQFVCKMIVLIDVCRLVCMFVYVCVSDHFWLSSDHAVLGLNLQKQELSISLLHMGMNAWATANTHTDTHTLLQSPTHH